MGSTPGEQGIQEAQRQAAQESNIPHKMSHTPTPWQARWGNIRHAGQRDTLSRCVIGTPKNKNGGSFVVCAIEGPFAGNEAQAKANAAFIVEACNSYPALKAERDALRKALQHLRRNDKLTVADKGMIDNAFDYALEGKDGE
jgi:hypothetical protein